jgi:uncharacterized protein (TIGR03435 family)
MCCILAVMRNLALFGLLTAAAIGQPTPSFEIADVHQTPRSEWSETPAHLMQGGYLAGDRYELHRATMVDLIRIAWNIDPERVYGGPSWLAYDRYEIVARTKSRTRPETLPLMLQSLLAERFGVVVKPDMRPMPGFVLSKGKGQLKIHPAADTSAQPACRLVLSPPPPPRSQTVQCRNVPMEAFVQELRTRLTRTPAKLPVRDSTGLEGAWDIDLDLGVYAGIQANIIAAVERLGLKVEEGDVPQQVLVVEGANEQPSPNSSDVAAKLPPPPPPEFEVASLKPCDGSRPLSPQYSVGGRLTANCMNVENLIRQAWSLGPDDLAGLPASLSQQKISIVAKAPDGLIPETDATVRAADVTHAMLKTLLTVRYQIKAHFEDQPRDAHILVAVRPKLAKADPAGRTGCVRGSTSASVTHIRLVCRNLTMAQFADYVPAYGIQVHYAVLDSTGLRGAWDFTVEYDTPTSLESLGLARGPGPSGQAAEPTGRVLFAEAIEKQLGLRLEMRKRPEPILVIDHIADKPAEN